MRHWSAMLRLCFLLALGVSWFACGGSRQGAPTKPEHIGSSTATPAIRIGIALDVTPRTATVSIDGTEVGTAADLASPMALPPGLHDLVVSSAGYKSYRAEFSVTDTIEKFVIRLEPTL